MKRAFLSLLLCVAYGMDLVGSYSGLTNAQKCFPNGNYVYVLDQSKLLVFDVSIPSAPMLIDSVVGSGYSRDLALAGNYAFMGIGQSVVVLDISVPSHPAITGSISLGSSDYVAGVAYKGGYLYVAATNFFKVFRFTHPSTLSETYSATYPAVTVDVGGNYVAIGTSGGGGGGLWVFNIASSPGSPVLAGGMSTPGYAVDVDIDRNRIYLADGAEVGIGIGNVLLMLTSDLHTEAGRFSSSAGDCRHGCANATQYVVANGYNGFLLLDWSIPHSPIIVDSYPFVTSAYAQDANVVYPYIYAVTRMQLLILTSDELIDTAGMSTDFTPPVVRLIEPLDGTYSSCLEQPVKFCITDDESGVNWESVRLVLNGYEHTGTTLYRSGDTIGFMPMIEWIDGMAINFALTAVRDNAGNSAEGLPISGRCVIDYSAPEILSPQPAVGETIPPLGTSISVQIRDAISGIDPTSITMILNSVPVSPIVWDGTRATYFPSSPLPIGTISACVTNAADRARYCGANRASVFCWTFYVSGSIVDTMGPMAMIIEPTPESYSSNMVQPIKIRLLDFSGIAESSIVLGVSGTVYSWGSPYLSMRGDTLIFLNPGLIFPEGVSNNITLSSYRDILGNSGTPVSYHFISDYTPPWVGTVFPFDGFVTADTMQTIQAVIYENTNGAGVNADSIRLLINGISVSRSVIVTSYGAIVTHVPSMPFEDDEVVHVTLSGIQDRINFGPPNVNAPYSWQFLVDLEGISESKLPDAVSMRIKPNPFNEKCEISLDFPRQDFGELFVEDMSGKVVGKLFVGLSQRLDIVWAPENLPSGVYRVVWAGEQKIACTVLLIK